LFNEEILAFSAGKKRSSWRKTWMGFLKLDSERSVEWGLEREGAGHGMPLPIVGALLGSF